MLRSFTIAGLMLALLAAAGCGRSASLSDHAVLDVAGAQMTVWLPRADGPAPASGRALLVLPGGGYVDHARGHLWDIPQWFAQQGYTVFVLRYSLGPQHQHPTQLEQARAAVAMIHDRADDWGLQTTVLDVLGISAGGHLAAMLATEPDMADKLHRVAVVSAVLSMRMETAGCRAALLGPPPADAGGYDPALLASVSAERRVHAAMPGVVIWHAVDDWLVPFEPHAQAFADALAAANVPHRLIPAAGHAHIGRLQPDWSQAVLSWLTAGPETQP